MPEEIKWSEFSGKLFITDIRRDLEITLNDENYNMGRFAVWCPLKEGEGHKIIEVGSNLESLQKKYNIPNGHILVLQTNTEIEG